MLNRIRDFWLNWQTTFSYLRPHPRDADARRQPIKEQTMAAHDLEKQAKANGAQLVASLEQAEQKLQVERAARERAEREMHMFKNAIERMRDIVLITDAASINEPDPRIVYANPALEQHTGYTAEEVIGRSPRFLQGPATDRAMLDRIRAALQAQEPVRGEMVNYAKNGEPYWTDLDIAPVFDAQGQCVRFVAVQHDITERRRMEEALQREQDFSAAIIQSSPTFFVVANAKGRIMMMNPAALSAFGFAPDEVIGLPVFGIALIPRYEHDALLRVFHAVARDKRSILYEMNLRTKSGKDLLVGWRAIPVLKTSGEIDFIFFTGADISAKWQAEEEKRRVEALLRQANVVLEKRVSERTYELSQLLQASRIVASTLERQPLLALVLDQLKEVLNYTACFILAPQPESDCRFDIISQRTELADIQMPETWTYDLNKDLDILPVLKQHVVSIVTDAEADTPEAQSLRNRAQQSSTFTRTKSWMAVPMVVRDRLVGVMTLHSDQTGFYTAQKANLALTFVNQAVVALENAHLFAAEQERRAEADRRRQVAEGLSDILGALNSERSLEDTLGVILDQARLLLNASMASVYQLQMQPAPPILHLKVMRCDEEIVPNTHSIPFVDCPIVDAIRTKQPIFYREVDQAMSDPRIPEKALHGQWLKDHFASILDVPIYIKDQPYGAFSFGFTDAPTMTQEDLNLVMVIADQAALAIENAQLRASSAQAAAMAERSRLARELHDSVSQALFGISLGTRTSLELLSTDPSKARDPMDYVLALAEAGMAEMRALIFELRPESLETEGLHAAYHKQAAALVARHKISVQTQLTGREDDLSIHVKEAIYRIGLEAIQNTIRHALSTEVTLSLERPADNSLVLAIQDNGAGFDTGGDFPGHFGLKTMRERAENLGGTFEVISAPGQGTCIRVRVPEAALHTSK